MMDEKLIKTMKKAALAGGLSTIELIDSVASKSTEHEYPNNVAFWIGFISAWFGLIAADIGTDAAEDIFKRVPAELKSSIEQNASGVMH